MTEITCYSNPFIPSFPSLRIFLCFIYNSTSFCFAICKITLQSQGGKTEEQQLLGSLVDGATGSCPLAKAGSPLSRAHPSLICTEISFLNKQPRFLKSLMGLCWQEPREVFQTSWLWLWQQQGQRPCVWRGGTAQFYLWNLGGGCKLSCNAWNPPPQPILVFIL